MRSTMHEYTVAIIPAASAAAAAIAESEALVRRGGAMFVLNRTSERPHVTLYYCVLPAGSVHRVVRALNRVAAVHHAFALRARAAYVEDRWVGVRYERTRAIVALHRAVVDAVNPIRAGALRERDRERLPTASPRVRARIERYGSRSVGVAFEPHLTFTRFAEAGCTVVPVHPLDVFSFRAEAIGLFTCGRHGTVVRLLRALSLQG